MSPAYTVSRQRLLILCFAFQFMLFVWLPLFYYFVLSASCESVCVPWSSLINWYLSLSCSGDGVQWCHTACCACRQIELPSCIDCITHLLVRAGGLSFSKYCLPPLCWFAHWNVIFNSSSNSISRNGSRKAILLTFCPPFLCDWHYLICHLAFHCAQLSLSDN